jgi:hypothetical protein
MEVFQHSSLAPRRSALHRTGEGGSRCREGGQPAAATRTRKARGGRGWRPLPKSSQESRSVGARVGTGWEPEHGAPYIRRRGARSQIGWAGPEWLGCSGLFGFPVHSWVKNETHAQTRFCVGQVRVQVTGVKMHPHPSGAKPVGDPKPEPELPSLSCSQSLAFHYL